MNKQQLANKIWASANKMRSKIEANEYKDYILGLIFYKFLSDTEVKYFTEVCDWEEDELCELVENYEDINMKNAIAECQQQVGFFIEYKYLFSTWLNDSSFSVQTLSEALSNFERLMSPNYASVYTGIFKTLREGLSKLGENAPAQTKALKGLIELIKDIPTDGSQDYDVLGYVYEFLISNFAANAGKKAGEFYTPHEVAMVMSEIVAEHHKEKESLEIYDPTSGSGSLLITIGKAISKHIQGKNKVTYYAQELKENTYNLTRMNLVMRGIIPQNIVTRCADTLEEDWPFFEEGEKDKTYQLVMDDAREWIKEHQAEILEKYNEVLFKECWDKYATGNVSSYEMESLCFYYHDHELKDVNLDKYGIVDFFSLSSEPDVDYYFKRNGHDIPIYKIRKVIGTVIGKNDARSSISLLTTSGVITVKFTKEYFAMYNRQMSEKQEDGTKKVVEKGWFTRGTKLMVAGFRRDDTFVA